MNMNRMLLNVVMAIVLVAVAGCANERFGRSQYLPDGEVIAGRAQEATVYDLDMAVQSLMMRMRAHPTFVRNYDEIQQKKKGKPILQVLPIDCSSCTSPRPEKTKIGMVRDKVCQSVFESDLFALRDAVWSEALQKTGTPDCVLRGTLTKVGESRRCYIYRLQLILTDAVTSDVLWQGTETVTKIDWLFH